MALIVFFYKKKKLVKPHGLQTYIYGFVVFLHFSKAISLLVGSIILMSQNPILCDSN